MPMSDEDMRRALDEARYMGTSPSDEVLRQALADAGKVSPRPDAKLSDKDVTWATESDERASVFPVLVAAAAGLLLLFLWKK